LFSAWQATTHAEQPVHLSRSIDMPHDFSPCGRSFHRLGSSSLCSALASSSRVVSRTIGRLSIEKWRCASASLVFPPVRVTATLLAYIRRAPRTTGASGNALAPTPLPALPTLLRP
jgi:hypothetical protein